MMQFTQLEDIDPQASLIIFQILLWIEERNNEYGELLMDISLALCEEVGSIDKVCNNTHTTILKFTINKNIN